MLPRSLTASIKCHLQPLSLNLLKSFSWPRAFVGRSRFRCVRFGSGSGVCANAVCCVYRAFSVARCVCRLHDDAPRCPSLLWCAVAVSNGSLSQTLGRIELNIAEKLILNRSRFQPLAACDSQHIEECHGYIYLCVTFWLVWVIYLMTEQRIAAVDCT